MASTAPGLQTRSSSANTAFLTAMSSNTASTTRSTSASASYDGRGREARHHARPWPRRSCGPSRSGRRRPSRRWRGRARGWARRARSSSPAGRRRASPPRCRRPWCRRRRCRTRPMRARLRGLGLGRLHALRARRRRRGSGRRAAGCRCTAGTACARASCLRRRAVSSAASTASTIFIGENRPRDFFAVSARAASSAARAAALVGQRRALARAAHRRLGGDQFLRVGQAFGERVGAVGQAVDQAQRQRFLGARRGGRSASGRARPCAPIRRGARCVPPAPGIRPSCTSGRPSLAAATASAVVRRQRDLQPAAERGAVDRGDHRLAAGLDAVAHLGQRRRLRRLAEFADVGAGDEVAAGADDQHRGHGARRPRPRRSAATRPRRTSDAEGVDRRVVDGDAPARRRGAAA